MNIGLLVSELEDKEVKRICIGACRAARDLNINLVIMPGKYLQSDATKENPFDYQQVAVFDYAKGSDFDALVIDIERIGKRVPILKKQAFLKKFSDKTFLTLTEEEGFVSVNNVKDGQCKYEQLGYEAICDIVSYADKNVLPTVQETQSFDSFDKTGSDALSILSKIGFDILHKKYPSDKSYKAFADIARNEGVNTCGILLYDKKVTNTIKYWWEMPKTITAKGILVDGKARDLSGDGAIIETDKVLSAFLSDRPKILVAGDIFVGQNQLGLLVAELTDAFLTDYFFDSLVSLITGASRVAYLENKLEKITEELYEVQEELARDDSVLDHIGDQDYLTGGLNRRGFFAKAYDLLKDDFRPNTYAIVAYIHMESLKGINEMFGHDEGDRAVRRVSSILEEVFEGCIYGRIRGNEFAVIQITDDPDRADNIREKMFDQNERLLEDTTRYMNHLQYSICEFGYDKNLSLREMLKETDENLQRLRSNG